jgi:DNA-binding CsgD family transcriptional regulator
MNATGRTSDEGSPHHSHREQVPVHQDRESDRARELTLRQRQVLHLLLRGYTNKRIAHQLGISRRTVESHRAHIMRLLGAKSACDLGRYASAALGEKSHDPFVSATGREVPFEGVRAETETHNGGVHRNSLSQGLKVPKHAPPLYDATLDSELLGFAAHGAKVRFHKNDLAQEDPKWFWACSWEWMAHLKGAHLFLSGGDGPFAGN